MTEDRIPHYDPFEDTGDWPFRDAPPKPERPPADEPPADPLFGAGFAEQPIVETAEPARLAPEGLAFAPVEPEQEPVVLEPEPEQPEPEPPVAGLEPAAVEAPEPPAEEIVTEEPRGLGEHAPGALVVPPEVDVLSGGPHGFRRNVAIVVSRFNGDITTKLLESAIDALRDCNVTDEAITVVPVPGAFELPLAALALAKTRRFACVVALGCVIRGETAHFDLIAGEAASGLQLAAIETGIPVSFGVVTCETQEQAEARVDRGAEAARTALEMADLFSQVRTRAAAG